MFVQGCGLEARSSWTPRQLVADSRASKLKEKYGTITKRMMKLLTVPDTINLTVNIKLKKLK
jgi:hypothetical protein